MKSVKSTVQRTNEEEVFKILGDEAPGGVCIIQDGKFRCFNSNFPLATGYTADELVGKDSLEIVVPEDREMVRENTIKMLKGKLTSPYQFRVTHKDGSIVWIMAAVKSIQYQGRRAVLGNYMEVTERKRMEDRLKESEQKYRLLFETSLDCITQIDREGRYLAANPAVARTLGVPLEEVIGKTVFEVVPQEVAQHRLEMVRKALDEWQPQIFEDERAGRYFHHIVIPTKISGQKEAVQVITRDITERKKMEEALRQSEERYRTILERMGEGYYEQDLQGNFTFVSDAMCRLLGYSADELIGMNYRVYTPEDDVERRIRLWNQVYRTGDPVKGLPLGNIRKDGTRIFVEDSVFPLESQKGEVIGFRGISTDVTERRKAVEALRRSEERYRTILEEMEDAYFEVNLDGHLTFVNSSVCRNLGYSTEELMGMSYKGFTVADDIESVFRVFNEVYQTGVPNKGFPWKTIRKDGSQGFAETSISLLRNDKGEIIGFRGVGRDITERKQAEQALIDEATRRRILMEQSRDGIVILNQDGHVYDCNQKFAEMVGYPFESMHQLTVFDWEYLSPPERTLEMIRNVDEKGDHFETEHRRKDGSTYDVEISTNATVFAGQKLIFCICRDITKRKRAEEVLRESEERYRTILEEMEDSYFEVDLGGHFTFANSSTCRNLGYSREELIGMSYKNFTAEDDIESVFRVFSEVYRTGVPNKGFPWKVIHKDGNQGFVEASVSLLRNDKGEIIGFRGVGRDITERKKTEEKLRQSRANYRALFDSSVIGTLVLDAATMKVVMANQAVAEIFGFSSIEEVIQVDNPFDFVLSEDRERVIEIVTKSLFEQGLRETHDIRAMTKDGRNIWITATAARIMHEGKLAGLVSFADITERKMQDQALADEATRRRILVDQSRDGIVVLDQDGKVCEANRRFAEMLGYTPEEVRELHVWDWEFLSPPERVLEMIRTVDEAGDHFETQHRCKNGSIYDVEISTNGAVFAGQKLVFCVCRDITERKQAEEKLRQSEENYRVLFDSAVIGTVVLDAETMKTVMVNQAAARMFGFSSAAEALEAEPFAFIPPEDKEKYLEIAKNLFEQNSHDAYDLRLVTRDGREIWINTTGAKIMHEGKLAGLISFRDITQQKQQNERLMLTDRLASLGELASGTAHELNNPLTSIIGFSQLLMEKEVPDDIREDLKLICSEAHRAASVTKNLLTFARKHALVKQRDQINNIVEDVLKLRTYEHKVNSIEVERQFDPDLPEIMVDYFQMQQVFMNIIINAEYFMIKAHNGGALTITTKKQNNAVMISIADDGPGIPPENLKRIFDPFFTTKEAGKGTGLGLSICHGIVTEHGGQIYARSQLGKGATFVVELPINSRDHIGGML